MEIPIPYGAIISYMKLSVFCSEKYKESLPHLRLALDDLFVEYQTVIVSNADGFKDLKPAICQMLSTSSISLIISDPGILDSSWLAFILGFRNMDRDDILFLCPDHSLPAWLSEFEAAGTIEELYDQIKKRIPLWNTKVRKEWALKTLEVRMREHTHQDFVKAVQEGDRFMTGVFLEAGFEVNKPSADQVSLLGTAARNGYPGLAKILLEAGADVNTLSLDRNNTALMDASSHGHVEMVRFFIENGAELEIKSKSGQTALILATGNGHLDCAETLIRAGADCDTADSMGLSARKYAQLYQIEKLLEIMPPAP